MATFVTDTFIAANGTSLLSHAGETGATWTYGYRSAGGAATIDSNAVHGPSSAGTVIAHASGLPATADYDVAMTMKTVTDNDSAVLGPNGRSTTGTTAADDNAYTARYTANGNNLQLFKFIANSGTQLGANFPTAIVTGDVVTLRMVGSAISLLLNGVTVIGPITDTAITIAGRAGVRFAGVATNIAGYHADSISAADAATVPVNTGAPAVTGTRVVGYTLTTDNGAWSNTPTSFAYQWQRDAVAISGATSSTYVAQAADVAHVVTCAVTASNANGAGTAANSNALTILAAMTSTDAPWLLGGGDGLGGAPASAITDPRALFDDVTSQEAISGDVEYRLMYLKNSHGAQSLNSIVAWIASQTTSTSTSVEIGVATEAAGATVATIADEGTAPVGVTFSAPSTSGGGLSLGDIPAGSYKGLWVRWTVAASAPSTGSDSTVFSALGTPV